MIPIDSVLVKIPEKSGSDFITTSRLWKKMLFEFCKKADVRSILEIGTALGYTTYFAAHFADKITTIDINLNRINHAKEICREHQNIQFIHRNVYEGHLDVGYHDLTIIDCIHKYDYVNKDIDNALGIGSKYIAFDDYGLIPEVKTAVDAHIEYGRLEIAAKIGYPKGTYMHMSKSSNAVPNKILLDNEGVICRSLDAGKILHL